METEYASGAVVYKVIDGIPNYLLLKSATSHFWGFPKGHVEAGEDLVQTAVREIQEETGLTVTINTDFKTQLDYDMVNGHHKTVTLFTAQVPTDATVVRQQEEISESGWFPYDEARQRLTYEDLKAALAKADDFITAQHD
ncbi:bis(5'-nucleosyl)-tetraphosphatase [Levilactobacillus bambusae]|uniref:Bis(5'-nucleosyl)-tetraphosphatase [asymmetrical] n=1 Tax=Levilactobacillus bambusae TaxID=2024736 RepID=A0A2V1N0Z2_9LACO|nr:bis(5'-nucleosyl)-tetraphosphatase [Levilactobacillus bambusae]PWG00046.1 NUDIX hydrolase [Levilactobacillus bambusae]